MAKKLVVVDDENKIKIVSFPPDRPIEKSIAKHLEKNPDDLKLRRVVLEDEQIPQGVKIEAMRYEFGIAEFKLDYTDMPIDWDGLMVALLALSPAVKAELGSHYLLLKQAVSEMDKSFAEQCWNGIDAEPGITLPTKTLVKAMMNACYFEIP